MYGGSPCAIEVGVGGAFDASCCVVYVGVGSHSAWHTLQFRRFRVRVLVAKARLARAFVNTACTSGRRAVDWTCDWQCARLWTVRVREACGANFVTQPALECAWGAWDARLGYWMDCSKHGEPRVTQTVFWIYTGL